MYVSSEPPLRWRTASSSRTSVLVRASTSGPKLGLRRLDELVERSASEDLVHLSLDLLADALLDVGAELFEGVELGGGARELVVEPAAPSP